jgi:DNA-binding transcriptional regulator YiaG
MSGPADSESGEELREARIMAPLNSEGAPMASDELLAAGKEIKAARHAAGLTQKQAMQIVGTTIDSWQNWEQGRFAMDPALFELFLLKTGQFTLHEAVPGVGYTVLRLKLRRSRRRMSELLVLHGVLRAIAEAAK